MVRTKLSPEQRATAANAVAQLLEKAGSATEGEIKNCITSSLRLGVFPKSDYGKILFTARVKKVQGRYYLMGTGPDKPEIEKTWKSKKQKVTHPVTDTGEQSITLIGDITVTIKGAGHDFKSKAVKVIVFVSILLGAFLVLKPF